jgi:hypothetical protein
MRIGCLLVLCCTGVLVARAQGLPEPDEGRSVAFYQYLERGESAIQVNVWGDVDAAGRYEVKVGTGLLELLFLAGAPTERSLSDREIRTSVIRLSRKSGDGWQVVLETPLERLLNLQQPDPVLQDEDILKIETRVRQRFNWRDLLTIVGTLGTLALLGERLLD